MTSFVHFLTDTALWWLGEKVCCMLMRPGRLWCHCHMVFLPMGYLYGSSRFVYHDTATDSPRAPSSLQSRAATWGSYYNYWWWHYYWPAHGSQWRSVVHSFQALVSSIPVMCGISRMSSGLFYRRLAVGWCGIFWGIENASKQWSIALHHACVFIARRKNDCRSTRALRPSGEETVIADDASISSILSIHGARVTNIGIDGLDCDSFNHLISDMLGINAIMTRSLSTLLWNKTNGNPFHALNFLDMLLHYIATVCCVARATALGRA